MKLQDSGLATYFFVDEHGSIQINHLNNSELEIREMKEMGDDVPLLLFAYCPKSKELYVTNLSEDCIKCLLECWRESKEGAAHDIFTKKCLRQMKEAFAFVKQRYAWEGEILSGKPKIAENIMSLRLRDFTLAWDYVQFVFRDLGINPINIRVFVIPDLDRQVAFLPAGESHKIDGIEFRGISILVRESNNAFFLSELVACSYLTNIHSIFGFDINYNESYLRDVRDYVSDTFSTFLSGHNYQNKSHWYIEKKQGNIFLKKDHMHLTTRELEKKDSAIIAFKYVHIDDSRYIVFKNLNQLTIDRNPLYREMYEFIVANADKLGHVNDDGERLKEDPIVVFDDRKSLYTYTKMTFTPTWVFIKNFLSPMYKFYPRDIQLVKGDFEGDFSFKYVRANDPMLEDLPVNNPAILWNDKAGESFFGSSRTLVNEYMKFIEDCDDIELDHYSSDPEDLYDYFLKLEKSLTEDGGARLALENELLIAIEENAHLHEYNLFKLLGYVVGFHRHLIEEYIFGEEEKYKELAKVADSVQKKIYYCALKSFVTLCEMKYGLNCKSKAEVEKNDLVLADDHDDILKIVEIVIEPEGKFCKCKDMVTGEVFKINYEDVNLLHLELDEKLYNNTKLACVKKANKSDWSYYKKLLDEYIRNPKRPNPLDEKEEEEDNDRPSFEKYLRDQSKYYEWDTDALVTETLLNENRMVKNYEQESGE
jgi:hypothetical protein